MLIEAQNITKTHGPLQVLKGVNLAVNQGEVISIVGASGAGKTTLLQIIGTLDKPTAGKLSLAGQDVFSQNDKKLSAFRNKNIGFVFQFHHLLPEFTALENITMPALIANTPKAQAEARAIELLGFLKLKDRANHKPAELSGGEQQRVAVARALINNPAVVLADEPSGNLDSANATELHNLFFKLREQFNQTFIIVTHNNELAQMADRMLTMKDGQIV